MAPWAYPRRDDKRLQSLRLLQAAADPRFSAEPPVGQPAQPVESSSYLLPHHAAPSRDSPEAASGGLVQESGHGNADYTVAHSLKR
jgi:hypothetical protein